MEEIDINKANSKEVRNMVRKILKNKFGMFYIFNNYLLLIKFNLNLFYFYRKRC